MNKREFLRTSGSVGLALLLGDRVWARFADTAVERLAEDEAFWAAIRAKYRLKPHYINLESGYYSMQATPVLKAFVRKARQINFQASYYLRTTHAHASHRQRRNDRTPRSARSRRTFGRDALAEFRQYAGAISL